MASLLFWIGNRGRSKARRSDITREKGEGSATVPPRSAGIHRRSAVWSRGPPSSFDRLRMRATGRAA